MFKVIDTHTHLDAEEFDEDRAEAFARAREAGVGKVFLPAIDVKTTHAVLALSREYPGYAYPMIGLHPEEVKADWKDQLAELRKMQISDFIAIGEIGLDYYWSREFEQEQLEAFEEQVKWSIETRLPLMIHCRKAQNEMVHLLRQYQKELPGGVFHCFTGNQKEAEELLSFDNFVLGIGGVSTFKSSHLREGNRGFCRSPAKFRQVDCRAEGTGSEGGTLYYRSESGKLQRQEEAEGRNPG